MRTRAGRRGAALAMLAGMAASSSPAWAQTLSEALVAAYEGNPRIAAGRAQLRAADERMNQAIAFSRPRVVLDGSLGYRGQSRARGSETWSTTLGIDQNVYGGGQSAALIRQRDNEILAGRARLANVEQEVLLQAATAYVDVVRARAVVELNRSNRKVIERQLEATRDRFEVGEVTRTDVAQAESRLSRAGAALVRADGGLADARAAFAKIVGAPPGELEEVAPPSGLPASAAEAIERARRGNFDLSIADHQERAARDAVDGRAGGLGPTVTLSARAGRDSTRMSPDSASLTARLSVPLYQSGAAASRLREARYAAAERRGQRDQTLRDVVERARSAWEGVVTARAQISALTDAVRAARIALEGVEQEAEVGSRTVLDVLDAEQEAFDARVNLVTARRDLVVAAYRLRAVVGRLTARELGLKVESFDPEAHYRRTRARWFGTTVDE